MRIETETHSWVESGEEFGSGTRMTRTVEYAIYEGKEDLKDLERILPTLIEKLSNKEARLKKELKSAEEVASVQFSQDIREYNRLPWYKRVFKISPVYDLYFHRAWPLKKDFELEDVKRDLNELISLNHVLSMAREYPSLFAYRDRKDVVRRSMSNE